MATTNDFLGDILKRLEELADKPIDYLRSSYPEITETSGELIRHCKDLKLTRGQLISGILLEEFSEEFPREILED